MKAELQNPAVILFVLKPGLNGEMMVIQSRINFLLTSRTDGGVSAEQVGR